MKIRVVKKGVGTELKDCGDADFEIWTVMAQEGLDKYFSNKSVMSLIGMDGSEIIEFAALEEGGKYGLGAGKAQAGEIANTLEVLAKKQKLDTADIISQACAAFKLQNHELTPTPSVLGLTAMQDCRRYSKFEDVKNEEPVFSVINQADAAAFTNEELFDVFMTPFLQLIFPDRVIINSEHFSWIPSAALSVSSTYKKPDFFIGAHLGVYTRRVPGGDSNLAVALQAARKKLEEDEGMEFRFGVGHPQLKESIILCSSKLGITPDAIGSMIIDHEHLEHPAVKARRGMIIDRSKCVLIESIGRILIERIDVGWTQPGSLNKIRSFFPPFSGWTQVNTLLKKLGYVMADPEKRENSAFLGAGACGRVFAVYPEDEPRPNRNTLCAVKVVLKSNLLLLELEYARLRAHHDSCADCDLIVRPISLLVSEGDLCGYAMSPVGHPLDKAEVRRSRQLVLDVFDALKLLHFRHKITHGDPRLENLIRVANRLMWIDFMSGSTEASVFQLFCVQDLLILAKSVLGVELSRDYSVILGAPPMDDGSSRIDAIAALVLKDLHL